MKKVNIFLTILLLTAGCGGNRQISNECDDSITTVSYELHDLYIPTDNAQLYFPLTVFHDFDNFRNKWYSKHLFAMREPIIFSDSTQTEVYRFVWLRTFHNPISIRIEKQQNIFLLTWKSCNGAGGYEPGQLTIARQKQISVINWENFKTLLNEIDFWNLTTEEKEIMGHDGSQCILEGKNFREYHVVDRWCGGEISNVCIFLTELTELTFEEEEKY